MFTAASPWPDACQAAVSLTFDDGMESQRTIAVPTLNTYELRGTFYVNPGSEYEQQLGPWRSVAAAGHELGNHTVSHPCSINFKFIADSGRKSLEEMSLGDMDREIATAGERLQALFPTQKALSFAYPCYQTFVGKGTTQQSYVPVVARHCVAGRARGEHPNDPSRCDPYALWAWACERMSGAELVGLVERAASQGRWAILTFHGIQEGHLPVGDGDLAELCAHLAAHRSRIWTAPVATIANRIHTWQQQHLTH